MLQQMALCGEVSKPRLLQQVKCYLEVPSVGLLGAIPGCCGAWVANGGGGELGC